MLFFLQQKGRVVAPTRISAYLEQSAGLRYHQSVQDAKDELLRQQILDTLRLHPAYGHRRIAIELGTGKRRVRRVMQKYGIKPYKRKARWRKRRDEQKEPAPYTNLIKYLCPVKPGVIFVSDFTYIKYREKHVYLATFMDLFTREVVGWHLSHRHTKQLVLQAFWDAVENTGHLPEIVHSDQGSEYTNETYTKLLTELEIQISMSKKGSPWENGYQESFYNNFKTDLGLEIERFSSLGELVEAIHHTITYYNRYRIHTTLKRPPYQHKLLYQNQFLEKIFKKPGT